MSSSLTSLIVGTNRFDGTSTNQLYTIEYDFLSHSFRPPCPITCPCGNPGFLTPPDKSSSIIYCADENKEGMLHTFRLTVKDTHPLLSLTSSVPAGVDPCHVAASPSLNLIFTSNYSSGNVAIHSMPSSPEAPPTLLHTLDLNKHYSTLSVDSSLHDRQEASHCHYSTFTDDGKFLLVCDLGSSSVTVFDLTTSPPSPVHTYSPSPDAGCRHLALVGDDVYIMCELISSVAVCKLNLETGELTESNIIPLLPSGTSEPTRAHHRGGGGIVADESGNFIYATLRNTVPGAVVALKRDAETGNVEIHKRAESGGEIPRCITCVGDDLVFVANQEDRKLCCFKGKGELELLAEVGDFDCSIAFVGELTG